MSVACLIFGVSGEFRVYRAFYEGDGQNFADQSYFVGERGELKFVM